MATKTCPKCGWVCDIRSADDKCPVCRTAFKEGFCRVCGKPSKFYSNQGRVCKECYLRVTKKPETYHNMLNRRREIYNEWIESIRKIPKNYPTLTEEQWMEAVKHFGGCALCKDESIDARGYFIPFKLGGRYCDWNIIPVCAECATTARRNPNYFLWSRPAGLMDVIDYLEVKINNAKAIQDVQRADTQ